MQELLNELIAMATSVGGKLIGAIVALIVGLFVIKFIKKSLLKLNGFKKLDPTVAGFLNSAISIALYVVLVITIIGIMGIPMASVVTVLASAGVAIGLSLQGALSNLAGGIMLMLFRPFKVGDYVSAAGEEGTVDSISVVYTVLLTADNKRITIPNGNLMNTNVTNYSSEPLRRVDLSFKGGFGTDTELVRSLMLKAAVSNEKVVNEPKTDALLMGASDNSVNFQLRAWCKSEDYWDVYFELIDAVSSLLSENNISAPATQIDVKSK